MSAPTSGDGSGGAASRWERPHLVYLTIVLLWAVVVYVRRRETISA